MQKYLPKLAARLLTWTAAKGGACHGDGDSDDRDGAPLSAAVPVWNLALPSLPYLGRG